MKNEMEDFENDVKNNEHKPKAERAGYYKLQNGENKVVILTNPVGFSECFKIGMAYKDCGYEKYASRKYKCYIKDLRDDKIKIMNISYTVAKKLIALKQAARTKFSSFPMPYVVNLESTKAGTKEVKTETLAEEDYELSEKDMEELAKFDPIQVVINGLESYQKKMVETDAGMKKKVADFISEKEEEYQKAKQKDTNIGEPVVQIGGEESDDEDEAEASGIPF